MLETLVKSLHSRYNPKVIAEIKRFWADPINKRNLAIILWVYLILNWLLYVPFVFHWGEYGVIDFQHTDTSVFMRYWDGPFYAGIAKTMYDPADSFFHVFDFRRPLYYTNHFPLFPVCIRAVSSVMPTEVALLLTNQIFAIIGVLLLYYFFTLLLTKKEAVVLSLVQLIIPMRTVVLRNVGNSEMVFFVFLALLMIAVLKRRWFGAIVSACLATATRPVGLFLSAGIAMSWWLEGTRRLRDVVAVISVPLVFVGIYLYQITILGGVDMATREGGFQQLLREPPFAVFFRLGFESGGQFYLYLGFVVGLLVLYKLGRERFIYRSIFWICMTSISYLIFSIHHDNSRYLWPFFPFVVLLPLKDVFMKKEVQIALLIMLPAIILSAWAVLIENQMPGYLFADWLRALHT